MRHSAVCFTDQTSCSSNRPAAQSTRTSLTFDNTKILQTNVHHGPYYSLNTGDDSAGTTSSSRSKLYSHPSLPSTTIESGAAMDNLLIELAKLRRDSNLTESIQDVDKILEQLEAARESIVQGRPLCRALQVYLLTLRRSKFSVIHSCKTTKSFKTWFR